MCCCEMYLPILLSFLLLFFPFHVCYPFFILISCRVVLVALGLRLVFMFPPSGETFVAYRYRFEFCFLSLFFNCNIQMQSIPTYFDDRQLYQRERPAKLYHPLVYWSCSWLLHSAFLLIHNFLFAIIAYFLTQCQPAAGRFLYYYSLLTVASLTAYFLCQCVASLSPNPKTAITIYPVFLLVNFLFMGFFQMLPDMEPYLRGWLPVLSFARWGYQGLVINELSTNPNLPHGQAYLSMQGFDTVSASGCFAIGLLQLIFYMSLLSILLMLIDWQRIRQAAGAVM